MTQDFHNQNLQSRKWRGQDLTGANFSGANLRGADFTNAKLVGANFSQVTTGQPLHWRVCVLLGTLFILFLAGLISAYAGGLVGDVMTYTKAQPAGWWSGIVTLFSIGIFIGLTAWRGLGASVGAFAVSIALIIGCVALVSEGTIILGVALVESIAVAVAIAGSILGGLAISITWMIARRTLLLGLIAVVVGTLSGIFQGIELDNHSQGVPLIAFAIAGLITLNLVGLSLYIGWRVVAGDRKYKLIYAVAIMSATMGGTRFRGADLTNADYTQANLKSADFRKATLTRTCWFQAFGLETSRIEGTYLEVFEIRQLVVSKDGQNQNFDRLDLREVNLQDANLQDATLLGADLSKANLENANLAGAKLVQAQLYEADLTGACLTGAYIQNWGISTDTKLNGVKCDCIFMQLPTKADPDPCRKPDNRSEIFKPGDFADFIAPIIKTLNLYQTQNIDLREVAGTFKTLDLFHYQGIDPTAAALALQQLADDHPEADLELVALEGRGNEKIRLQAVVARDVNRSELSAEYFSLYQQMRSMPYKDLQSLLTGIAEKDERIRSLEQLLTNALQQPKFYVETYQNQGEFIMSQSKGNINISGVQGNVSGVAAAGENQTMTGVAIGAISGTVTNTINQLPASPDPNNPGIKELLAQLQAAIETESELPDEDKKEALEQVKTLAEAGHKPEDNALQKAAKTSMKILKGTVASLPDAAKLVESCAKLLPAIASLLALV